MTVEDRNNLARELSGLYYFRCRKKGREGRVKSHSGQTRRPSLWEDLKNFALIKLISQLKYVKIYFLSTTILRQDRLFRLKVLTEKTRSQEIFLQ